MNLTARLSKLVSDCAALAASQPGISPLLLTEMAATATLAGEEIERLKVDRDEYRDALQNMMGAFDNAISRRRYPPDDFMQECIKSGRAALGTETV